LKNSNGTPFEFSKGNPTDNLEQAPPWGAVSNLQWYKYYSCNFLLPNHFPLYKIFVYNIMAVYKNNLSNLSILSNRYILYFILFVSLADLLILSIEQDFISIIIFILIGYLTFFFSKNMIVILSIPLITTNIIKYGSDVTKENFENSTEETKDEDLNVASSSTSKKEEKKEDKKTKTTPSSKDPSEIVDKLNKLVDLLKSD